MYKIFSESWLTLQVQMPRARLQGAQQKTTAGPLKELSRDLICCLVLGRQSLKLKPMKLEGLEKHLLHSYDTPEAPCFWTTSQDYEIYPGTKKKKEKCKSFNKTQKQACKGLSLSTRNLAAFWNKTQCSPEEDNRIQFPQCIIYSVQYTIKITRHTKKQKNMPHNK